jgi:hypothetical protein
MSPSPSPSPSPSRAHGPRVSAHPISVAMLLHLLLATGAAGQDLPDAAISTSPADLAFGVVPKEPLLVLVADWAALQSGLPAPSRLPNIAFAEPSEMDRTRLSLVGESGHAGHSIRDVIAFYDVRSETIFLPAGWAPASVAEMSILLHEMVHHLQAHSGRSYPCPEAREKEAFSVQSEWLSLFGESLEEAFGIDGLTLLVLTHCAP